jgi:serine/threonine protein kinase
MDVVDDNNGDFVEFDALPLSEVDRKVLLKAAARFQPGIVRYLPLARGLSSATKVILKPESLFPLIVKIDAASAIETEYQGDRLIRDRVPPLSVPPFEGVYYEGERGGIVYRYITGGRVRELARRLDRAIPELKTYEILKIVDDIFDVILKKCHWLDGKYTIEPIRLPEIRSGDLAKDGQWEEMLKTYDTIRKAVESYRAPHGIVHGDLHAQNVLLTRDDAPVLVDFARAARARCQYIDFAKFDAALQFQVDGSVAEELWRIEELVYGGTQLVIPHSNAKLASCIHGIRSNLWQGCTRRSLQMDPDEVDFGYRAHLIYQLMRIYTRTYNSTDARHRALHQASRLAERFN